MSLYLHYNGQYFIRKIYIVPKNYDFAAGFIAVYNGFRFYDPFSTKDILMKSLSMTPKQFGATTTAPDIYMNDRGAYMSVNSSLQQLAGGIASLFSGLIVVQATSTSPLQNFDVLGYVMIVFFILCLLFVYRVNLIVKKRLHLT